MFNTSSRRERTTPLTRISVTGSRGLFVVRDGGEAPVQVRIAGGELRCECGAHECAHIASLLACGFVEESSSDLPMAA